MTIDALKAAAVDTSELRRLAEAAKALRNGPVIQHYHAQQALARAMYTGLELKVLALCNAADHAGELLERLAMAETVLKPFAKFWSDTDEQVHVTPGAMHGGIHDVADDVPLPTFNDCYKAAALLASLSKPLGGAEAGKDGA